MDACRVGRGRSSETVRPVKVTTVFSKAVADQILQKSGKYRSVDQYKDVFVNPDRSPEQREQLKVLVKEVKRLSAEKTNEKHFIRNGKVSSVAKTVHSG